MTKFHINPETGQAGPCTASVQACRYGADAEHYGSEAEAAVAYENTMSAQTVATLSRNAVPANLARTEDDHIVNAQKTVADTYEFSAKLTQMAATGEGLQGANPNELRKAAQLIDDVIERGDFSTREAADKSIERLEDLQDDLNKRGHRARENWDKGSANAYHLASEGLADIVLKLQ